MGQKVHPYGFRLGYNKNWLSRWYSKKDYASFVFEDSKIRKHVKKLLYPAGISKVEIERFGDKIRLILSTARPGIIIGRKGAEIEKLRGDLKKKFGREFALEVNEIRRPEIDAQLVAEAIGAQLERRVAFRRAMKRTVAMARKFGADVWQVLKLHVPNGIVKAEYLCKPFVLTLITDFPKLAPPMVSSVSKCGSTKVKSLIKRWNNNACA